MDTEEKEPIFTKKRIIIMAAVLLLLLVLGYFLFFRGNSNIKVERVELAQTNVSLKPGETFILRAYVSPTNATNKTLQYSTTDASIITVNNSGLITAVKEGTAQIVVKSPDTNIVAACDVTVSISPDVATGLAFETEKITINKGAKKLLTITVTPSTAQVPTLSFTSSDSNVVTVDNEGYITGVNIGSATITVTGDNGTGVPLTASVSVDVSKATTSGGNNGGNNQTVKVSSITLNNTAVTVEVGKEYQLVPTIQPTNATNKTVTWASSDTKIATVDNTGKVKGITTGTATVTATVDGKTATSSITVVTAGSSSGGGSGSTVSVTGVNITNVTKSLIVGTTRQLYATVSPSNATNKRISWSSSNTAVLSVSSTGVITGNKVGTATITAKSNNGKTDTLTINVTVQDITAPSCGTVTGSSTTWTKSDRSITVGCSDSGSGCQFVSFTKTFIDTAKTGTVTITDKAGNHRECLVNVYVDKTAPVCQVTAEAGWHTSIQVTVTATDSNSGVNSVKFGTGAYTAGSSTSKYFSSTGNVVGSCIDNVGNISSSNLTLKSRTEYQFRTYSAYTYSSWVAGSTSCNTAALSPNKATAESTGGLSYYSCLLQTGGGGTCSPGKYECKKYTRSITGGGKWSDWSIWTSTPHYPIAGSKEVNTRTVYSK